MKVPARAFTELRFDWHTSGQARLSADGRLVAYHNAVAPGAQIAVDRVIFGLPGVLPEPLPIYLVSRVFVRVLLRSDSLAMFSRLLPVVQGQVDDPGRCRLRMMANLLRLLDRLRSFMTTFHLTTSRPWSQEGGPPQGPFNTEATQAHELAVKAGVELAEMLRTGEFSAPERFLEPFTQLLRILRSIQPSQFDALVTDIGATDIVPEGCRELLKSDPKKNRHTLAPLIALLSAAAERVRGVSEGAGQSPGGY